MGTEPRATKIDDPQRAPAPDKEPAGSAARRPGILRRIWKRLFGNGSDDPFASRLSEFVTTELPEPAPDKEEKRPDSLRQKLLDAQQTVINISDLFVQYVQAQVIRRHPKDFGIDRLDEHEAYTLDGLFEISRGSAETRYVRVLFRNRFHLLFRVEAAVLSRTLNVCTIFIDEPPQRDPLVRYLDLEQFGSVERVRWNDSFQKVFLEFFDWCQSGKGKA